MMLNKAQGSESRYFPLARFIGAVLLFVAVVSASLWHLSVGAKSLDWVTVWQALTAYDPSNMDQAIVRENREARLIVALVVGASLALSGVIMQAISSNPLADPGLLGINSGAAFFVVAGLLFLPVASHVYSPLLAFLGAGFAALFVMALSGWQQSSERLVLAGMAVTAMFSAMTAILLIMDQQGLDKLRHWLTGAIGASDLKKLDWVYPYLIGAVLYSFALVRSLNAFHLGERVASSLGVNVLFLKVSGLALVIVLSGCVVAVAGPIGFVGLVVPHMARLLIRNSYLWLFLYSLLLGALLLILSDIVARLVLRPYEINTGIITAFVGAPVFIALVLGKMK
ncbi:FecCD family ABC transporter permease [Marinomonas mediterranea]|uniref:FecCD family ABC transporter permease n=1 Tax=Marinomonas mediterranea TaxID=119864 RepID=UPI0023491E44|nr:iron ABC transporter permease [Marinomonas mediterranea]WCN08300.1 iron chelate uptake ABC transporter family permease subunit [Marinomonas mediterranea]WCN12358.1 iron chelate uptake ABC transporter family permease subunit [Marinomonas mediterranea]